MLNNIKIVLVRTYHPGNIGSAARAMKTMGLNQLVLVEPREFPSVEADKMASNATDILQGACVVETISQAIADCHLVLACTARSRGFDLPEVTPEQAAHRLTRLASQQQKVALIFGPERMGLSNQDLHNATHRVMIPTSPDYSSLNMASAVQILSYEIYKASLGDCSPKQSAEPNRQLPEAQAMQQFYAHFEETLNDTGFIIKNHPGDIMKKLQTLFRRAEMDETELNILRGILASIQRLKN